MFELVYESVLSEFACYAVAGTSHSGAIRASALDHETVDYPVEDQAVVETGFDKADKVIDRIGSEIGI